MGKLVVGPQGVIEGEVKCKNADISGLLKVNIQVDGLLNLKATAKLMGDIKVKKIAIEPGAVFSGKCEMTGGVPNNDEQKEVTEQRETEKE